MRAVLRWRELNADKKTVVQGRPAPEPNDEYLLYQTLIGAWPPEAESAEGLNCWRERVVAYLLKAIKEAKANTSWTQPNPPYEAATTRFVQAVLDDSPANRFLWEFKPFQRQVAHLGLFNSLSQVLLKMTVPGVPDFYQGTELWDLSLVDPDNRRPVDYTLRRRLLDELRTFSEEPPPHWRRFLERLLDNETKVLRGEASADVGHCGQLKLAVIWRALQFRRLHRDLFDHGDYVPLPTSGHRPEQVCAFARVFQEQAVIVLAPRLAARFIGHAVQCPTGPGFWHETFLPLPDHLPAGSYRDVISGEILAPNDSRISLAEALRWLPVALLEPAPNPSGTPTR